MAKEECVLATKAGATTRGLLCDPERCERDGDMPKQVLVVDDGGTMADSLCRLLPDRGYAVSRVDRKAVLQGVRSSPPDLIVLDGLSAPDQAMQLAQRLRQHAFGTRVVAVVPTVDLACDHSGVTCLTQVPTEDDLVAWLGEEGEPQESRVLRVGRISLDLVTRELTVGDQVTILTPKQFKLLSLFMQHPGEILTRKQLMKEVWDTDYTGDTRTLDVHVHWAVSNTHLTLPTIYSV